MRNLQTVKTGVSQIRRKDGSLTDNDKEAAEELCNAFKEAFTIEADAGGVECENQEHPEHHGIHLNEVEFTTEAVFKKLIGLDSSKSPGPDGLHPHLLKSCAKNVARPLMMIFQRSFQTGTIPQDWKTAVISPIFKKGLKTDPGN
jgi:hypothetical protein